MPSHTASSFLNRLGIPTLGNLGIRLPGALASVIPPKSIPAAVSNPGTVSSHTPAGASAGAVSAVASLPNTQAVNAAVSNYNATRGQIESYLASTLGTVLQPGASSEENGQAILAWMLDRFAGTEAKHALAGATMADGVKGILERLGVTASESWIESYKNGVVKLGTASIPVPVFVALLALLGGTTVTAFPVGQTVPWMQRVFAARGQQIITIGSDVVGGEKAHGSAADDDRVTLNFPPHSVRQTELKAYKIHAAGGVYTATLLDRFMISGWASVADKYLKSPVAMTADPLVTQIAWDRVEQSAQNAAFTRKSNNCADAEDRFYGPPTKAEIDEAAGAALADGDYIIVRAYETMDMKATLSLSLDFANVVGILGPVAASKSPIAATALSLFGRQLLDALKAAPDRPAHTAINTAISEVANAMGLTLT